MPGRSQSPETLSSLTPDEAGVPSMRNHSQPCSTIRAAQPNVSQLFTIVGRCR